MAVLERPNRSRLVREKSCKRKCVCLCLCVSVCARVYECVQSVSLPLTMQENRRKVQ